MGEKINSNMWNRIIYSFTTMDPAFSMYEKIGDTYQDPIVRHNDWVKNTKEICKKYGWDFNKFCPKEIETIPAMGIINDNGRKTRFLFRDYEMHSAAIRHFLYKKVKSGPLSYISSEWFNTFSARQYLKRIAEKVMEDYLEGRCPNILVEEYDETDTEDLPEGQKYNWDKDEFQEKAVKYTVEYVEKGGKRGIIVACCRFGKTFVAFLSAKELVELGYVNTIVIATGQPSAKKAWRKVFKHCEGSDKFYFVETPDEFEAVNNDASNAEKTPVIFISMCDDMGKVCKDKFKYVHNFLNDPERKTLLFVDEAHFATNSPETGVVLKKNKYSEEEVKESEENEEKNKDIEETIIKEIPCICRIDMTATAAELVKSMQYKKDDFIYVITDEDMNKAKMEEEARLYEINKRLSQEGKEPIPMRYNRVVKTDYCKLGLGKKQLGKQYKNGDYSLSSIFKVDENGLLCYPNIVLDIFKYLDKAASTEGANIFKEDTNENRKNGFYTLFTQILFSFNYVNSCEAVKELLEANRNEFEVFKDYKFYAQTDFKNCDEFQATLARTAKNGGGAIYLWVRKWLTGTDFPELDTIVMANDTRSTNLYFQVAGRVKQPLMRKYVNKETGQTESINVKDRALVIDLKPERFDEVNNTRIEYLKTVSFIREEYKTFSEIAEEMCKYTNIYSKNAEDVELTKVEYTSIVDLYNQCQKNVTIMSKLNRFQDEIHACLNKIEAARCYLENIDFTKPNSGAEGDEPNNGQNGQAKNGSHPIIPTGNGVNSGQTGIPENNGDSTEFEEERKDKKLDKDTIKRQNTLLINIVLSIINEDLDNINSLKDIVKLLRNTKSICSRKLRKYNIDACLLDAIINNENQFVNNFITELICTIKDDKARLDPKDFVEKCIFGYIPKLASNSVITPMALINDQLDMVSKYCEKISHLKIFNPAEKTGAYAYTLARRYGGNILKNYYWADFNDEYSDVCFSNMKRLYEAYGLDFDEYKNHALSKKIGIYATDLYNNVEIIKELRDMKFDLIIANPPYQESDGGGKNGSSAEALYDDIIENLRLIGSRFESYIIPMKWLSGGKGLDEFREKMLNDKHIVEINDFIYSKSCFSGVSVKGGVGYFLRDEKSNLDKCLYKLYEKKGKELESNNRVLSNTVKGSFIRYMAVETMFQKIQKKNNSFFDTITSTRNPYNLPTDFFKDPTKYGYPEVSDFESAGCFTIYGKMDKFNIIKYADSSYPVRLFKGYDKYKVFLAKAAGDGSISTNNFNPIIAKPNDVCTDTYLQIGEFENKKDAENCGKYITTRFFKTLIGGLKLTQLASKKSFSLIPLEDFTENSDIDWNKDINDIDQQLFKKYELSDEEITFIEKCFE